MMPAIHTVRLPPRHNRFDLEQAIARSAGSAALPFRILRCSLDARNRKNIHWLYRIEVNPQTEALSGISGLVQTAKTAQSGRRRLPPYVIGSGPAGLFAALYLAQAGLRPVIIERGRPVEQRAADVAHFWQTGRLDPSSNVQFGEGGAGTFSDGKLTTGIKDPRCRTVLEELVMNGAPEEILWLAKPHVGTDRLRRVVVSMRQKIQNLGGTFRFSCRLTDLVCANGRLQAIVCTEQLPDGSTSVKEWPAAQVILAVGHSARDTFQLLQTHQVALERKPFSLGVRIEHRQSLINLAQYGPVDGLPAADYKLACHLPGGRSVYTFCMCPGGQVIAAASEPEAVVTNGMSLHARQGCNANSAILVNVTPEDFPGEGPLAGLVWQRELERNAFQLAGRTYAAPVQQLGTFLRKDCSSQSDLYLPVKTDEEIRPSYRPAVAWCELNDLLPPFVTAALQQALPVFERKLAGFASPGAVLTAIETRSSSPVRILRNDCLESSLGGLYAAGEGAGYAGGIVSAAVDGLRCAESLAAAHHLNATAL